MVPIKKKDKNHVHLRFADFHGDNNIGLFGMLTEKYAVLPEKSIDMKGIVKKVAYTTVAGTKLCGLFIAGNSYGLIVPKAIASRELESLKKSLKEINILQLESNHNALGNLILCNDKGAIVSPLLEKYADEISKCLKVKVSVRRLLESDIVGALGVATNKGFLINMYASEKEYVVVKKVLHVGGDIGTVNFGSEFVKSGMLANSKCIFVGRQTTGPECSRIDEALGFL